MIKHKMRAAGPVLVAGTGERCLSALNSRQFLTEDGAVSAQREILVKEASLYIHWPYCLKRCSYCNFNKYIPKGDNNHIVSQCLQQEVATLLQLSQVSRVTSVFLGGGTPSLAHPSTVSDILEAVSRQVSLAHQAEVSLEVNPTPEGRAKLKDFSHAGVNRFSIGVQSLQNDDLSRLGRDHSAHHALQTVEEARRLRPGKVSVDVMFGRPGQSLASWEAELSELLQLCDDHVSLYQLTPERGTLLFKQIRGGEVTLPGDHVMAEMYESARRTLQRHGFEQYEVSNFARNSEVSHHNMSYWKGRQYIGVGPGAHGRFVPLGLGGAHREARTQTLEPDVWIREVRRHGHGTRRRIQLGHLALLEEVLVMGLRMTEGITHKHWQLFSPQLGLRDIFGSSADVQEFFHRGQLTLDDGGLHCSRDGLALLDSMLPTLLLELERQQTVESAKS
ncbi:radical S-adenosyl methionine domain-containing protein 1, mitochondrial isoform X1 [Phyllopteryx taeniolatus]|uniref:radical S-adenosyl methionine domain-containing protein 1, mitochondrial isoform X1 n=1 Tax=Phyllopteryx taeniolatus TaxID=161469 RepID=UPI002AD2284E|nr:radical S-adenosyl methionine domain-containing protein 1, mitochondrial isoform X1 [Phyllopteryx taeniolatus]XP_061605535.1 radical S-adenosyl methionine domain-containing protein 1, mitochondrial isoform X1 [Phyllopteryx taeniolatus]